MRYLNKNCSWTDGGGEPFLAGRRAGTFNGFEVIPPSKVTRTSKRSYQRLCGWWTSQEGGRGQFLQTCEPEALQKGFRCGEAQPAVGAGEFLHKLEIPKFHNEPALVGVEKLVDFRLADWLPKGDAGEHFKGRGCQLKNLRSRHSVRSHRRPTPCFRPG